MLCLNAQYKLYLLTFIPLPIMQNPLHEFGRSFHSFGTFGDNTENRMQILS